MIDVQDNTQRQRFELMQDGHAAFAAYEQRDGTLVINYVEAAIPLRGTGAASRLMEGIVAQARHKHLKIVPICGYAVSWFRRHPEHADLLGA